MDILKTGQFFGSTKETKQYEGLTLTDTEYTHDKVDWHYHENAYFTFLLDGKLIEGNKKEVYNCTAGSLLFHHWQEAHYNIKPKGFARGFHIELERKWFNEYDVNMAGLQGSLSLTNPGSKLIMYNIFKEAKLNGMESTLAINALLNELFDNINRDYKQTDKQKPNWVFEIRSILKDSPLYDWSLSNLAQQVGIHPVHLSRDFSRYFNCSLGEYIRNIKIKNALQMLQHKNMPITAIALACGFADQSHFNRLFKTRYQITPLAYRRLFK